MSIVQKGLLGEDRELPAPAARQKIVEAAAVLPPDDPRVHVIQTEEAFGAFMEDLKRQSIVAFDTETSGLNWQKDYVCGYCFGFEGNGYYLPTRHLDGNNLPATVWRKPLVEWFLEAGQRGVTLIMHHEKFDIHMVESDLGLNLPALGFQTHDTMLQAHLLRNDGPKALKMLAERNVERGAARWEEAVDHYRRTHKLTRSGYDVVPVALLGPYAAADAIWTYALHERQYPAIDETFRDLYAIEMRLSKILQRMERIGLWCDLDYFRALEPDMERRMREAELQVYDAAGRVFDIDSTQQLGNLLFNELNLPKHKLTAKGNPSLDNDALKGIADLHPVIPHVMEYRGLAKKLSTYVRAAIAGADENWRVHTNLTQTRARTGRMSSTEPNLQNVDKGDEIRRGYGPDYRAGYAWYLLDYSQIEVRLFAHYAKDEKMIDAFMQGHDIYRSVAAEIYGIPQENVDKQQRSKAKTIVLGIQYGMGAQKLAASLGMGAQEGRDFLDAYYAAYPSVRAFQQQAIRTVKQRGYVFNVFGRRSYVDRDHAYLAVNYLIQGCAADLLRVAMLRCTDLLSGTESRLLLPVHDELIFEIKAGEESLVPALAHAMADFPQFRVPIRVDVSVAERCWADEHELEQVS